MEVPKPKRYDKAEDLKNMKLAAQLDLGRCQWCLLVNNKIRSGSVPHHIFGKRRRWNIDSQITLCMECHSGFHVAKQKDGETIITKEKLIALMEEKVIPARKLRAKEIEI